VFTVEAISVTSCPAADTLLETSGGVRVMLPAPWERCSAMHSIRVNFMLPFRGSKMLLYPAPMENERLVNSSRNMRLTVRLKW